MNNQFDVTRSINGDTVIGFTSAKEMKDLKFLDAPRVSTYLLDGEDTHKKHLGMINLFATTEKRSLPFMRNLMAKSAVLEVSPGESITYDLPVSRTEVSCYTTEDTSSFSVNPGRGETVFPLVLSMEYTKGDILTYDPMYGDQVMVSDSHEVEAVGDGYRHWVLLVTNDDEKYFPIDMLKPGIQYMKLTNVIGEYGTNYSNINLLKNPAGSITNEFILGDPRSVETFYTAKAAAMKAPGFSAFTDQMRSKAAQRLEEMGGDRKSMFFTAAFKYNADGTPGFDSRTVRVGATLEYLALAELALMESQSLLFSRPGTFRTAYGNKMVNEGVWHQLRRGKIIKYAQPGGITFDQIHEAVSYIFKNSDIPVLKRRVKFKVGSMAHANLMQLFREEAIQQLTGMPAQMIGTDSQIQGKLFTGQLDNLHMNAVQITSVVVPGIGMIEVELDESLDYQPLADRFAQGFYGNGYAHTSYSMVIEDATNPIYSNVTDRVKGGKLVENGSTAENIYYIKPEGSHVVYGYEQGRMANEGQTSFVQSSLKQMGRTFWATSNSAALILDTTRYVVIELQR